MDSKGNRHLTFESVIDSWGARIVRIFYDDWIDCRGLSLLLFIVCMCNGLNIAESEVQ